MVKSVNRLAEMFFLCFSNKENLIKHFAIGIIGIVGTCLVLYLSNSFGAGMTPDSVEYISVARNLVEGNGFLTYNGSYLVFQPPLFPILLALVQKVTLIDPLISVGYVNAFLFGFIIYFFGLLLSSYIKSFVLVLLGTLSILISYAFIQASLMALTEPLFILLVVLFLYYFEAYQSKRDFVSLFILSISAALASLTRYTGVMIILTGICSIIFFGNTNKKEKLWHSIIFILLSCGPISTWLVRNFFLSGTIIGQRATSSFTFSDNWKMFYNTVIPWYVPLDSVGIYLIFILVFIATWFIFDFNSLKFSCPVEIKKIAPTIFFLLFYSGAIIISSTTTAYDQISDRLLSPIYIPINLLLFFFSDKIIGWLNKSFPQKWTYLLFLIGFVVFIRCPVARTADLIDDYVNLSGYGYSCNI